MTPSGTKARRLNQIEMLLLAHPEGLTQSEIARRLDVHRSTVSRYLPDLPGYIYIDDLDGNRWKVDRQANLIHVCFNLHEATSIHLAARLLALGMNRQNPHAAAALRKLGAAVERLAPHISRHVARSADAMDELARRHDQNYLRTLEVLTLAWSEGRKTRLWYRKDGDALAREYTFSPYYLEPYPIGRSTYAIGFSEPQGELRTFKLDRIERVELLPERFQVPPEFAPLELFADAWGIWFTNEAPVEVRLKFSPGVARRVQETRWHRSEQVEELEDGSLVWQARIAEPQEMLYWIRGWGNDCEVLAPPELREAMRQAARRWAEVYGWEVGDGSQK